MIPNQPVAKLEECVPPTEHPVELTGVPPPENQVELPGVAPP